MQKRLTRLALFAVLVVGGVWITPTPAVCRGICPAAMCVSSAQCLGSCVCLRQGADMGDCVSLDRAPELLSDGWTRLE